jgi:hypothetical protein
MGVFSVSPPALSEALCAISTMWRKKPGGSLRKLKKKTFSGNKG